MSLEPRGQPRLQIAGAVPASQPQAEGSGPGPGTTDELVLEQPPQIPNGEYAVKCVGAEDCVYAFGRKAILRFEVVEGQAAGTRLFYAATLPERGKSIPFCSKFYRASLLLESNGHRLERRDRFSLRHFLGVTFVGRVRRAKARPGEDEGYSVIDDLIRRIDPGEA